MAWLKGPRSSGVIQINQPVKFNKQVQSAFFEPWADVWYVDQDNGNNSYDGKGPSSAKATIAAAVAAMSARDVIYLRPGSTDHVLSAALSVSDNDVQIVGVSPNRFHSMANTTTFNPMITFSGRGGYFANMTIKHGSQLSSGVGYATDLSCALISGRYNYFDNVYFYTPLYAEQDVVTTYRGVYVTGHNNYFRGCKFGSDGLERDKANFNLEVTGVGNIFEDCIFQMYSANGSPYFAYLNSGTRDMKYTIFKNCLFYAHCSSFTYKPDDAIKTNYQANTQAVIFDSRCQFVNVSQICDTDNDVWVWIPVTSKDGGADTAKKALIALRNQGV